MSKKGLSDVVTTVLIILLVVAAVSAVWYFIQPTIKGAGKSIEKGQVCLTSKIEILGCTKSNVSGQSAYAVSYRVLLDTEKVKEANSSEVSIEFADGSVKGATGGTLKSGEAASVFVLTGKTASKAKASGKFLLNDGSVQICDSAPVNCIIPAAASASVSTTPSVPVPAVRLVSAEVVGGSSVTSGQTLNVLECNDQVRLYATLENLGGYTIDHVYFTTEADSDWCSDSSLSNGRYSCTWSRSLGQVPCSGLTFDVRAYVSIDDGGSRLTSVEKITVALAD